jgi:hypothetical protein
MFAKFAPVLWEELVGIADELAVSMERVALRFGNDSMRPPIGACSAVMTADVYGRNYDNMARYYAPQLTLLQALQRRQSPLRMPRKATIIQRAEKTRLKMVGACEPGARSRGDGPGTGFDDRSDAVSVKQRVVVLHGVRKLADSGEPEVDP